MEAADSCDSKAQTWRNQIGTHDGPAPALLMPRHHCKLSLRSSASRASAAVPALVTCVPLSPSSVSFGRAATSAASPSLDSCDKHKALQCDVNWQQRNW